MEISLIGAEVFLLILDLVISDHQSSMEQSAVVYEFNASTSTSSLIPNLSSTQSAISNEELQWLGADSSASVYIHFDNENKYNIWLYGDTIIGRISEGKRRMEYLIRNSLGVSKMGEEIKFHWGHEEDFHNISCPDSFFTPTNLPINSGIIYWPMQASAILISPNTYILYIFTPRVIAHSFLENDGSAVIICKLTIDNINKDPNKYWECVDNMFPQYISSKEIGVDWGFIGNIIIGGYFYMLGNSKKVEEMVLSRLKLEDLIDYNWERMEYWGGDAWNFLDMKTKMLPKLAAVSGLKKTSETSINYSKYLGKYISLQATIFTKDINIYMSQYITGPYEHHLLYKLPIFYEHPQLITYAIKIHPQLAKQENELVFTYNTNVMKEFEEFINIIPDLYVPQFVRIIIQK